MMKKLLVLVWFLLAFGTAKEMVIGSDNYNFALYSLQTIGSTLSTCDAAAISEENAEWMCGSYGSDFESFVSSWENLTGSESIMSAYQIHPYSDWMYYYEPDGSLDYYGKIYSFKDTMLLAAYDPSEIGREIFIGISPFMANMVDFADGKVDFSQSTIANLIHHPASINKISGTVSNPKTTVTGAYNCEDFATQAAAQAFFDSNGFSATYDPYGLDFDSDGMPCESIGETVSDSEQCPPDHTWVSPHIRTDGVHVRGYCRKRR